MISLLPDRDSQNKCLWITNIPKKIQRHHEEYKDLKCVGVGVSVGVVVGVSEELPHVVSK